MLVKQSDGHFDKKPWELHDVTGRRGDRFASDGPTHHQPFHLPPFVTFKHIFSHCVIKRRLPRGNAEAASHLLFVLTVVTSPKKVLRWGDNVMGMSVRISPALAPREIYAIISPAECPKAESKSWEVIALASFSFL